MWDSAVITNTGKSLLANWITGSVLNIDSAAAGQGVVADISLMAQTGLVSQRQTLSIIKKEVVEGGIRLQLQCTSKGVTNGYIINQIGVWASLDDGESVLIAIYQDMTGVSVPTENEMPDYVFTFYAVLEMSNEGQISVNIDTSALVTHADLQQAIKGSVDIYFDEENYPCWKRLE